MVQLSVFIEDVLLAMAVSMTEGGGWGYATVGDTSVGDGVVFCRG